jgi:hypothetical protein
MIFKTVPLGRVLVAEGAAIGAPGAGAAGIRGVVRVDASGANGV